MLNEAETVDHEEDNEYEIGEEGNVLLLLLLLLHHLARWVVKTTTPRWATTTTTDLIIRMRMQMLARHARRLYTDTKTVRSKEGKIALSMKMHKGKSDAARSRLKGLVLHRGEMLLESLAGSGSGKVGVGKQALHYKQKGFAKCFGGLALQIQRFGSGRRVLVAIEQNCRI